MTVESRKHESVIRANRGVPFKVIPDFSTLLGKKIYEIDSIYTGKVEIRGLGKARLNFYLGKDYTQVLGIDTPVGPIVVSTVIENERVVTDLRTLPVFVNIEVYDASEQILKQILCEMIVGKHRYFGDRSLNQFFIDERTQKRVESAVFDYWVIQDTGRRVRVYYPQQSSAFSQVQFVVR